MHLKSALTKEVSFPRGLSVALSLLALAGLSYLGIVIFGFWNYGLFFAAILGMKYLTAMPRYRQFAGGIRTNLHLTPSRIRKDGMTAIEFLSWAMDQHAAMKTFRATMEINGRGSVEREISYERPNRYRITTKFSNGHSMTSVCDGARLVEYSVPSISEARSYPAPGSIAEAWSMFMMHPMFCGSLLNRFFAGRKGLDRLAAVTMSTIAFGAEQVLEDELCREVGFYGVEGYGNTWVFIGTRTGRVHRIVYDSESLMRAMASPTNRAHILRSFRLNIAKELDPGERAELEKQLDDFNRSLDEGCREPNWTYCTLRDIRVDGDIPESTFDTAPPGGVEVVPHDQEPRPPVPIGDAAPDATVFDLQGKEIKLSDFRGKVLLIDVWATWCGPCRKGLPDTAILARTGRFEGFEVLAVSHEDSALIQEFLAEEGLQDLPTYSDPNEELWRKYNISSIPTVIVVDAQGNLADYLVGLRPPDQLRSAIEKARRN